MSNNKSKKIAVMGKGISVTNINQEDYICITDIAKNFGGDDAIKNWMKNRNTIEFLGIWEQLNNPNFKLVQLHQFKAEAGLHRFLMSPKKWIENTNAIGIISKSGRYGGTYAHKDIAFEFGAWISPEFKLLLIKEFQRLKSKEREDTEWNYRRFLSKVNYRLHTDSVKENLIAIKNLPKNEEWLIYAKEADILNMALFGTTAKEWRESSFNIKNINLRDQASIEQLTVLSNLENINSVLIDAKIKREERFYKLREIAKKQLKTFSEFNTNKNKKMLNNSLKLIP
jgi:hypothetical protein